MPAPEQPKNLHEKWAETPGDWRLIPVPKPSAVVTKYLTFWPSSMPGIQVEKYSTRFGANFEKWTYPNGVEQWYKLTKIREATA